MFKNNKTKRFLVFSVILSRVLFCGTSAHAVKIPPNSVQVTPSRYLRGPMRKPVHLPATLLKDIKNGDAGDYGKYIVIAKSGLLIDIDEDTGELLRGLALVLYRLLSYFIKILMSSYMKF